MIRLLPAMAVLALPASRLDAQVGLASSGHTVVLTARKHGSVGVAFRPGDSATLAGGLAAGASGFEPLPIETAWDLDPSTSSAVSLVAYYQAPEAALAGGTRATLVLFTQPVILSAPSGRRTDRLPLRIDLPGRPELPPGVYQGTLNLRAITQ
jgi:hypothetical protein